MKAGERKHTAPWPPGTAPGRPGSNRTGRRACRRDSGLRSPARGGRGADAASGTRWAPRSLRERVGQRQPCVCVREYAT